MDTGGLSRPCFLLLISVCVSVVSGTPVATSTIDCTSLNEKYIGAVTEGYTGDVEVVEGIKAGHSVELVPFVFPDHLKFLELNFTLGDTVATIRTRKPLDADALTSSDRTLYYGIRCDGDIKYINSRTLRVYDINDNHPIFHHDLITANISEATDVGSEVLRVTAVDHDSNPANYLLTYSIEPSSDDFLVTDSGAFILMKRLNYNVVQTYNFALTAKDSGGLNDTVTVVINVEDYDDYNPHFSHSMYHAFIPENNRGSFRAIEPAAIRAQDGDTGINMSLLYSISAVSPAKYTENFNINRTSGELSLKTAIDREEMKDNVISVFIQAFQSDDILKTADSVVFVTVEDVNDNVPEFDQSSYSVSLLENSPVDAVVLKAIVTDQDEGGFVGNLRILPESAPFYISADGTVKVKNSAALDREITDTFTFQIEANETNSPNHVAVVQVSVNILDENDNSPEFTSDKYNASVTFGNQKEGMLLVQVVAIDLDLGANAVIKYSIDFGNDDGYFSIEENTGRIMLAKTIPLVENQFLNFLLYVSASDGGIKSRSSSAQVNIHAAGKSIPQFLQTAYKATIEEEQDPGAVILKVDFLPKTAEFPVDLQVNTESDKFSISSSGELTTNVKFDCDEGPHKYSVEISISDRFNNSGHTVVEVEVTDINDNSPLIHPSPIAPVPENAKVGTNVTVVVATDKDSGFNKEIRYWLSGGEGSFAVDPVSGLVSVIGALDRETKTQYNLQVVAEDRGHPSRLTTTSLLVQVSDVNDNIPKFSQAEYQAEPLETMLVGELLLTLSALDPDDGVNGKVTYSILQQRPQSDAPVFELDSSNGSLRLAQPLDYSKVKMYRLIVEASDGGSPSLVGNSAVVVRVKGVNNNRPEFSQESYHVTIPENLASNMAILTVKVTDRDEGRFVGTLQILSESAPFSISPDGTIRVKDSTRLDRETTERIVFEVEARETEQPDHVAKVNVTVTLLDENDNSPEFTSSKYETKVSNQTQRMLLMRVEAKDPDAGVNGQIKYSIDFGNENGYFSIDGNTGAIHLAKIIPVDVHQTLEFLLLITARDGGIVSHSATAQVKIVAVGDMKPQFTQNIYSVTIEEETVPGTKIFKVDFLATGEISVDLQVETESDKFNISNSGELTTEVKLDYDEGPKTYSVKISISDGVNTGYAFVEVEVTDINDNSPIFNSVPIASVLENAKVGTNVTVVVATDKDSGFNEEVRYWLNGGEGSFAIDPVSGLVSVIGALDRETKAEYNLQVVAEDQGHPARSTTTSLLVQVSDVNDNVPKFSQAEYQVKPLETESEGALLLNLSAVDPDDGVNGKVTYSILQQRPRSDTPVFELDSSNGVLRLAQSLDYSKVKMYKLIVEASDGGSPSLVGNSTVVVRVEDVNNNPPEFSQESYDVTIPENLASGMSFLTLGVTDRDEGGFSNGYFEYTSDTFDINEQGVVSLRKDVTLDRETIANYVFEVVAVDQTTDGLRATAQLNITVLDYNDNTPQFPAILDIIGISENDYSEKSPGKVATIMPTDADFGPNGEVTLSLFPPHPLFKFTEDGTLLAVGSLDRERMETYDLVVKASDKGSPQRENITTIRLSLIDLNDNRPEFSSSSYFSTVMLKDAEQGKLLLTLSATDRDAGENALITYSFCEGSSQYLALDSKTGAVTLTSDFANVAEDTILQLTAMATDHGQPPLNSTARVVVELRAVRGVAFLSSFYNFSIPENEQEGTMVGKVTASSENNLYNVTYALKTHTDQFSIGADGTIQTRKQLDKEEQDWYLLDVEAVDTRIPPTSATTVVMVQVEDVNEPPVFLNDEYEASLHSIAPYKTPVVQVQALDPDVGHQSKLVYSMTKGRPYFDVEPSTGLVYVVSVVDLGISLMETEVELEVKATDPKGRSAKTTVEVEIRGDASTSDVVVIFINRPAYTVEKKVQPLEKSLRRVLKWDVGILEVSSANDEDSRQPKASASISFVCVNKKKAISSEMVIARLENRADKVQKELRGLFGKDLQYHVGASQKQSCRDSNHPCCDHKSDRRDDDKCADVTCCPDRQEFEDNDTSDKERSDVDRHDEGSMDESHDSETSEQGRMESPEKAEGQVEEEGEKKDGQ